MNMTRTALITGVTGQDGAYLAEFLLARNYEVHGLVRRASTFNKDTHNPDARLTLHYGDLTDGSSLRRILHRVAPNGIYNLGAQSHVIVSFDQAEYTADVVAAGTLRLEAIRDYFIVLWHLRMRNRQSVLREDRHGEPWLSSTRPNSQTAEPTCSGLGHQSPYLRPRCGPPMNLRPL